MAKLCDIVKPGVPCKVKRKHAPNSYNWTGERLMYDNFMQFVSPAMLFDDDWQLDDPTVESVLRERGYSVSESAACSPPVQCVYIGNGPVLIRIPAEHFSKFTTAEAKSLCLALDRYRQ